MPTSPPTGFLTTLAIKGRNFSWFDGHTPFPGVLTTAYWFGSWQPDPNVNVFYDAYIIPNTEFHHYYGGSAPYGGSALQSYVDAFNDGNGSPFLIVFHCSDGYTSCLANISTAGDVKILTSWGNGTNPTTAGASGAFSQINPGALALLFSNGPVLQFYYQANCKIYSLIYDASGVDVLWKSNGSFDFYDDTFLPYITFPTTGVANSYFMVPNVLPNNQQVVIVLRLQSGSGIAVNDQTLKLITGTWDGTTWTDLSTDGRLETIEQLLSAGTVNVVSAVSSDGTMRMIVGNDYLFVDGTQFQFNGPAAFTYSGTAMWYLYAPEGAVILSKAVTITSGTQSYLELTAAQTGAFASGGYRYEVKFTLADASVQSLLGECIIRDSNEPF